MLADCWVNVGFANFSFDFCCKGYTTAVRGHPDCWGDGFTYDVCCLPEIKMELDKKMLLLEAGDYRAASHELFDLHFGFARHAGDDQLSRRSFSAFEKAVTSFRKGLDEYPRQLSWFDLLFDGFGVSCPALAHDQIGTTTVYDEFLRCCDSSFMQNCFQIFELFANALGARSRRLAGGEDKYYRDFSEQWAFHHFTPSILLSSDIGYTVDPCENLAKARQTHSEIASALTADDEPMLGIVWGENRVSKYKSPKFCYGIFFLTLIFKYIFFDSDEKRPVEIFEVGAGYGSIPRIISQSRQRLSALSRPINVQRYTIFDVRSVIDLQRWYFAKTIGEFAQVQDWSSPDSDATFHAQPSSPMRLELVEREHRDMFVLSYSSATKKEFQNGMLPRPLRIVIAINSWHEMPMSEYVWYYKEFVAGPEWHMAADWIFYVSNFEWDGNSAKEDLLFGPGPGQNYRTRLKDCSMTNCMFLLERIQPSS